MAARMRFVQQALAELKAEDPNTNVTEHYLRQLVKSGAVPTVTVGRNRKLLNYDKLLEYLENPQPVPEMVNGIRRIG